MGDKTAAVCYALLSLRRSERRKRHALAGLHCCTTAHLARGCSERKSARVGSSSTASTVFSSTLPDTTPVDCFISRVESMLQIPQMRSN